MNNRELGSVFEGRAADFLQRCGYQLMQRNFRCKIGEIDLIAKAEGYLCFIEVKYRATTSKGFPSEAITPSKIRRITRTAEFYMLLHKLPTNTPCRFDVVMILGNEISLIKNAFNGI